MEEDDFDFVPSQTTSTNLASLFGFMKKPAQGNSSLTYVAPKPPKKEPNIVKSQKNEEKSNSGVIICSMTVNAYKWENKTYVNQGVAGIVITGNYDSHIYAIILYKPSKEHLSKTIISKSFSLTLAANNYVSFYDNNKQNWSVMFLSTSDVEQFVEKIAISKFYCQPESSQNIMIQDLTSLSKLSTHTSGKVDIIYSTFCLSQESLSEFQEDIKATISLSDAKTPLAMGLLGCKENSKRIIIIPNGLARSWLKNLASEKDILLRIKIEKIYSELESILMDSKLNGSTMESPLDSSAEENQTKKSKEIQSDEAPSLSKSQKANLISRMARMGQAALPINQGLASGQSDSEEEMAMTPSKIKLRNRQTAKQHQSLHLSQNSLPETTKQLSIYHNEVARQSAQVSKYGLLDQPVIPTSPVLTPDPNMSVYMTESRIHAAEIRMGISKLSEKMDIVINKIQDTSPNSQMKTFGSSIDSSTILSSIQNLISENEVLKTKVEEQKEKLERQEDRIFHLLELNHRHLEQNSFSHTKQSEIEIQLRKEMELCLQREVQLESDNKKYLERVKSLEEELEKSEEAKNLIKKASDKLTNELDKKNEEGNDSKKLVEIYEEKIVKASEIITKLKEKLKEVMSERDGLQTLIETQKAKIETYETEIGNLEIKSKKYEETIENLRKKNSEEQSSGKSMSDCFTKQIEILKKENEVLRTKVDELNNTEEIDSKNSNKINYNLKESFSEKTEKPTSVILPTSEKRTGKCVQKDQDIIVEYSEENLDFGKDLISHVANSNSSCNDPENKCEFISCDSSKDLRSESEEKESELKISKNLKKESNSRYKSYDQGWRTHNPPPVCDDDCDEEDSEFHILSN